MRMDDPIFGSKDDKYLLERRCIANALNGLAEAGKLGKSILSFCQDYTIAQSGSHGEGA